MATLARRAINTVASRTSTQATSLIQRRGLSGAADPHGTPKVNIWHDPMSPSKWKEEQFVILSLSGWGLIFYGGYSALSKGKGKKEEKHLEATH